MPVKFSLSLFLRSVLFVVYAPAEVIIFLSAVNHGIDLEQVEYLSYLLLWKKGLSKIVKLTSYVSVVRDAFDDAF